MHRAWTVDLATQHAAQLQAAAATWRRGTAAAASLIAAPNAGEPPFQSITQRAGWALILRATAPQSPAEYGQSRSWRRRILPVVVFGSSSMISTRRGYL